MAFQKTSSRTLIVLHLLSAHLVQAACAAVVLGIAAAIVAKAKQPTTESEEAVARRFNYSSASYILFVAASGILLDVALTLAHMCVREGAPLTRLLLVERGIAVLWFLFWLTAACVASSTAVAWVAWWTTAYPWVSTYAAMIAFAWISWLIWLAIVLTASIARDYARDVAAAGSQEHQFKEPKPQAVVQP